MRVAVAIVSLSILSLFAGCAGERQTGSPVPLKSFTLNDVQGLWGGQALWAAEDRTAYIQVVGRPPAGQSGLWEKRYKTTLTAGQWAEFERLVGAHHLLTAKIADRPGVPDEAQPMIMLQPKAGAIVELRKWANDKHPGFDPVYAYLLGLCRAGGELIREGPFEGQWRPEGFEQQVGSAGTPADL